MKKKILGMLVCILLIATAFPVVESLKDSRSYPIIQNKTRTSPIGNWTEKQKLIASDGVKWDNFGWSVSLDGDTALIGAANDDNGKGSVYVFTRTGTAWMQQTKLFASDGTTDDFFGNSVSLYGDTALIGAEHDDDNGNNSGSVYVFKRTGSIWTQEAKLLASDGTTGNDFGCSVSLYGDIALIGASDFYKTGTGSAYVFVRTGSTWTQQTKLLASDGAEGDFFGWSVSLCGDNALVGAFGNDDNGYNSGSAYIFTRNDTTWTEHQILLPLDNEEDDYFGWSVTVEGGNALIGAKFDKDNGPDSGSAYIFTQVDSTWTEQQKLLALDGSPSDQFGFSVSLCGNTALIGANFDNDTRGSAYIFARTDTIWTQRTKLLASDGAEMDDFGSSVSLDGDTAFIGAHGDDDNRGSVYEFKRDSSNLVINLWGGIGVNADIKNFGATMNVTWQIEVKGSILGLIHKSSGGTLIVQGGESRWVSTGPFLGIGPFTVVAKANEVEKTVKGIVLLFYVIILT
jgi:hypothetical protein